MPMLRVLNMAGVIIEPEGLSDVVVRVLAFNL